MLDAFEIIPNLPVLIVTVPLIGGVMTIAMGRGKGPWAWATLLTGVVFYFTVLLMQQVLAAKTGVISYELGNWPRQWGIEYRVDALNAFILLTVAGVAFVTTLYAQKSVTFGRWLRREAERRSLPTVAARPQETLVERILSASGLA